MTQAYRTAAVFKQALEQRLRTASASGVDFARRRQLVVFDRFFASSWSSTTPSRSRAGLAVLLLQKTPDLQTRGTCRVASTRAGVVTCSVAA